jgi:hypothetical protein
LAVQRLALAVLVGVLTFSVSGVSSLTAPEPCGANESAGATDRPCPPTCVTCGCCTQAAEESVLLLTSLPDSPLIERSAPLLTLYDSAPRDILHVPKALRR